MNCIAVSTDRKCSDVKLLAKTGFLCPLCWNIEIKCGFICLTSNYRPPSFDTKNYLNELKLLLEKQGIEVFVEDMNVNTMDDNLSCN